MVERRRGFVDMVFRRRERRPVERAIGPRMAGKQLLKPAAQVRVSAAHLVEVRRSFGRVGPTQGFGKEVAFV